MVNNFININKANNITSLQTIEHKKNSRNPEFGLGQAQQCGENKPINWMPIPISAKTEKTCTYSLPLKNVTRYRSQKMNDNINTYSKIAASANTRN